MTRVVRRRKNRGVWNSIFNEAVSSIIVGRQEGIYAFGSNQDITV